MHKPEGALPLLLKRTLPSKKKLTQTALTKTLFTKPKNQREN
jgi:hypothetical protein